MREFLKNCESCDEYETERLKLRFLDSLSRVIHETETVETVDDREISALNLQISVNETLLSVTLEASRKAELAAELLRLKKELQQLIAANGHLTKIPSPFVDATPEGI